MFSAGNGSAAPHFRGSAADGYVAGPASPFRGCLEPPVACARVPPGVDLARILFEDLRGAPVRRGLASAHDAEGHELARVEFAAGTFVMLPTGTASVRVNALAWPSSPWSVPLAGNVIFHFYEEQPQAEDPPRG